MDEQHRRIKPTHRERARELRRKMTVPERVLWSVLRKERVGGLCFRRQHPIGPFVADFCCIDRRLVVEVDGMTHVGGADRDDARTRELEARGYRVVRFSNDDVLADPLAVAEAVARVAGVTLQVAEPAQDRAIHPHPGPPPKRGRE